MIRPLTCVCMLLAGGSGLYLYQTKHRALLLDREIAHTVKQTEAAHERITALRAEWALLNEPERLAELNTQHLGLRSLAPTQFVALADLPSRLPAPLPPGSVIIPEPSEEVVLAHPEPAPEPARSTATRLASAPVTPVATPVAAPATVPAMPVVRPLRTARREEPAKSDTVTSAAASTVKPPAPVQVATANPVVFATQPSVAAPIVLAPPTQIASAFPTPRPAATVQPVSARTPIVLAQPRLVLNAAQPGRSSLPALSPVAAGTVGEAVQRASQLGTTHASAMAAPTPYTGR